MTNVSDGSGETNVVKVDATALTFMTEDGNRKLSKIWYSVNTHDNKAAVELSWDHTVKSTIALLLSGQGYWDLRTPRATRLLTILLIQQVMYYYLQRTLQVEIITQF